MNVKQFFTDNPKPTPNQIINFINKQKDLYNLKTMGGNYITTSIIDLEKVKKSDFIKFADTFNDSGYIGEITVQARYIVTYYKINQQPIALYK